MLKIILGLFLTSTFLLANMDFDELDQMNESNHNDTRVEKDLEAFEASLDNSVDMDKVQPAAGFEELDANFEDEDLKNK